jgi:hypothetical protein
MGLKPTSLLAPAQATKFRAPLGSAKNKSAWLPLERQPLQGAKRSACLAPGQVESAHGCYDHGENYPMSDFCAFGFRFFRVMKFSQATHDVSSWM